MKKKGISSQIQTRIGRTVGIIFIIVAIIVTLVANASITDSNNQTKYKGATIVNVTERMTEAPELKETMMSVGKKQDMDDENFDAITKNVYDNPYMSETVYYMATSKDENNNDRFKTENIRYSSDYLVSKDAVACQNFDATIKELSGKKNLDGSQITELTKLATQYPEYKDQIINEIKNSNLSGEAIVEKCKTIVEPVSNVQKANNVPQDKIPSTEINTDYAFDKITTTFDKNVTEEYTSSADKLSINGAEYNRKDVLKYFAKEYGTDGEKILQNIENPEFIGYMRDYSGNKAVMKHLVSNPQECVATIKKLKNASSTISSSEMAELLDLCQNTNATNMIIEQIEKQGVTNAISMTRKAKLYNKLDDMKKIFEQTSLRKEEQKERFEYLMNSKNSALLA